MVGRARYYPWLLKADFQIGHLLEFAKYRYYWAKKVFCDPIL
jgi:hypothetical protein